MSDPKTILTTKQINEMTEMIEEDLKGTLGDLLEIFASSLKNIIHGKINLYLEELGVAKEDESVIAPTKIREANENDLQNLEEEEEAPPLLLGPKTKSTAVPLTKKIPEGKTSSGTKQEVLVIHKDYTIDCDVILQSDATTIEKSKVFGVLRASKLSIDGKVVPGYFLPHKSKSQIISELKAAGFSIEEKPKGKRVNAQENSIPLTRTVPKSTVVAVPKPIIPSIENKNKNIKTVEPKSEAPPPRQLSAPVNKWGNRCNKETGIIFEALMDEKSGVKKFFAVGVQDENPEKGTTGRDTILPLEEKDIQKCIEYGWKYNANIYCYGSEDEED